MKTLLNTMNPSSDSTISRDQWYGKSDLKISEYDRVKFFDTYCDSLKVSDDARILAQDLYNRLKNKASADDLFRGDIIWAGCSIYLAGHKNQSNTSTPLLDILSASNIKMFEFVHKVKTFCTITNLDSPLINLISDLEKKFYITTVSYRKFYRIFPYIFQKPNASVDDTYYHKLLKFTWLLFIFTKEELLAPKMDLVTVIHFLICCFGFVSSNCEGEILSKDYRTSDRLTWLCDSMNASKNDVLNVKGLFDQFISSINSNTNILICQDKFQGVIGEYLDNNISNLWKEYAGRHLKSTDFDERMCTDPTFIEQFETPSVNANTSPPDCGPNKLENTAKLIENLGRAPILIEHTSSNFQEHLHKAECQSAIDDRLKILNVAYVNAHKNRFDEENSANFTYSYAVKLYLQVLEVILECESKRVPETYTKLLFADTFQKALLAVSLEVVLFSCDTLRIQFDEIIDSFSLQFFDFIKVVETFIRSEPMLTRDHIKHLGEIEEHILEESVWRSGSRIFDILRNSSVPAWTDTVSSQSSSQTGQTTSKNSKTMETPPRKKGKIASQDTPTKQKENHLFFRKLYNLLHTRFEILADDLSISQDHKRKIWTLIEYTLQNHYKILTNRHVDQIIICCVYGMMCLGGQITFKSIIFKYRLYPRVVSSIYREVPLENGKKGPIISFYNSIFMPEMKDFILSFAENTPNSKRPCLSPLPSSRKYQCVVASPMRHKVSKNQNFFVSPRRQLFPNSSISSQYHSTVTPRSRKLFCFGNASPLSSPSKNLTAINQTVNVKNSAKYLIFDHGDSPAGPTPSISRRLNDIANDTAYK